MAGTCGTLMHILGLRLTGEWDPRLWLENVTDPDCLDWAKQQNAISTSTIGEPTKDPIHDKVLAVLDSKDKIPYVKEIGDMYYNLWQDEKNKRGLWRRTTLDQYKCGKPTWETVLDIDELNQKEDENWVYKGSVVLDLGPDSKHDLVLLKLSRGGADATVIREFNVETKSFVTDNGFFLPEAKTSVTWKTRDVVYVGTDTGPGSMTDSGYARTVREWQRGTPLQSAKLIYEGKPADVAVHGVAYYDRGLVYHMMVRAVTFYTSEHCVWSDTKGAFIKLDVPEDAEISTFYDHFLIQLRSDWTIDGTVYPQGSLVAIPAAELLEGKQSSVLSLFAPSNRVSLSHFAQTKSFLILHVLDNVQTKIVFRAYDFSNNTWTEDTREWQLDNMARADVSGIAADRNEDVFITLVQKLPEQFNSDGLIVEQYEATSLDGTKIPYFIVRRGDMPMDGSTPTLLYGYGGFEISLLPQYMATIGVGWLERGGVFVFSNIRGGGEFGPEWHQAALKEKRHKSYEDFIACGKDLIARGVTSTPRLGIMGGSNGGLLMGNMLTMEPSLWGAIVCQVPLLDMKRFNKLLAGASWMGEYGNPDIESEWKFLQKYSPYHNLKESVTYPPALFTTSTRDDRVHPGHARKMVKKLLDFGSTTTLYYENIEGGHGGAADNGQRAFMKTLEYNFLWTTLTQ